MLDLSTTNEKNSNNGIITDFNLVVSRAALVKALAHLQTIVERRNIIPILSNVKLSASNNKLKLTTTDMDIIASEDIIANIASEGEITVPVQTMYDIARKLPDDSDVVIKKSINFKNRVEIYTTSCNFLLPFIEANEFPMMDYGVMPFEFSLKADKLRAIIDKNKFSISTEETRYNLNGIYLHINTTNVDELCAAATDGHRLSRFSMPVPKGADKIPGTIIPKKAMLELRKIIENIDTVINIKLSSNKIMFKFNNLEFVSKLIDGKFPDYQGLIPSNFSISMLMNKKTLIDAVDRVSIVTFDKIRSVKFYINQNKITVSVSDREQGEAKEVIDCVSNADNFEITFNSRYITDVISVIEGNDVEFCFTDRFSSCLIKDPSDKHSLFVIMPMRV